MYNLIDYNNISKKEWALFIMSHSYGNIFQTPEMYDVYSLTKNYEPLFVGVADTSGDLVGILISTIQKEFRGPLGMLSSRCVTWGGPLIKEDLNEKDKTFVLDLILKEQNRLVRKRAIYMEFRNMWDTTSIKSVFEKNNYIFRDHLDIIIDLRKSEEELWKQMKRDRRRNINRAKKEGLQFAEFRPEKDNFDYFFELIQYTYDRVKVPLPDVSLFKSTLSVLQPKGMAHFFYVKKDDEMLASRIALTYKKLIYDWYAGSSEKGYIERANEYLVWKILLWAKNKGYTTFDFGGAGDPNKPYGPREFKMRFGGTVVNYGRYQNIFKKRTFKLAMKGLEFMKKMKKGSNSSHKEGSEK